MSTIQQPNTRNYVVIGMWAVVVLLGLLFVVHNSESVDFSIAFITVTVPLWLLVVAVFALGAVVGWLTRWLGPDR